jgi:hypothetical protein
MITCKAWQAKPHSTDLVGRDFRRKKPAAPKGSGFFNEVRTASLKRCIAAVDPATV